MSRGEEVVLTLCVDCSCWLRNLLSVPKFNANLYCICLSIPQINTDAVQICGKFWNTQYLSFWCLSLSPANLSSISILIQLSNLKLSLCVCSARLYLWISLGSPRWIRVGSDGSLLRRIRTGIPTRLLRRIKPFFYVGPQIWKLTSDHGIPG